MQNPTQVRGQQCPVEDRETVAVVYLVDLAVGCNGIYNETNSGKNSLKIHSIVKLNNS